MKQLHKFDEKPLHNGQFNNSINIINETCEEKSPIEHFGNTALIHFLENNNKDYEILENLTCKIIDVNKEKKKLDMNSDKVFIILNSTPHFLNHSHTGDVDLILISKNEIIFIDYNSYTWHVLNCVSKEILNIALINDQYLKAEKIAWKKDIIKNRATQYYGYPYIPISGHEAHNKQINGEWETDVQNTKVYFEFQKIFKYLIDKNNG